MTIKFKRKVLNERKKVLILTFRAEGKHQVVSVLKIVKMTVFKNKIKE